MCDAFYIFFTAKDIYCILRCYLMDIKKIDKNFRIETDIDKADIVFYDCRDSRFEIHGVIAPADDNDIFRRMPQSIADSTNDGVKGLNTHTAGGRIRIKTDSPYIAIKFETVNADRMAHMPCSGSMSFDMYEKIEGKETYIKSFITENREFEGVYDFTDAKMRELTLNMPLYGGLKSVFIGLSNKAKCEKCTPYTYDTPVVYYGSSITQGGCASRPGNSYQAMISRRFDCDYLNLGFSGSARGETVIAEYIATLDMSIFVYDYDHNAPNTEHLAATHKPMFDIIRKANPELPVVMVSRPNNCGGIEDTNRRFEIIKATYDAAVAAGDKNVYLVDGRHIMDGIADSDGTVDGCHPNDLGFYCMAQRIGEVLEEIFKKQNRA